MMVRCLRTNAMHLPPTTLNRKSHSPRVLGFFKDIVEDLLHKQVVVHNHKGLSIGQPGHGIFFAMCRNGLHQFFGKGLGLFLALFLAIVGECLAGKGHIVALMLLLIMKLRRQLLQTVGHVHATTTTALTPHGLEMHVERGGVHATGTPTQGRTTSLFLLGHHELLLQGKLLLLQLLLMLLLQLRSHETFEVGRVEALQVIDPKGSHTLVATVTIVVVVEHLGIATVPRVHIVKLTAHATKAHGKATLQQIIGHFELTKVGLDTPHALLREIQEIRTTVVVKERVGKELLRLVLLLLLLLLLCLRLDFTKAIHQGGATGGR